MQMHDNIENIIIWGTLFEPVFCIVTTIKDVILIAVNPSKTNIIGASRYPKVFFLITIKEEINIKGM